jgi:non-specific protein-tyrosine kinase
MSSSSTSSESLLNTSLATVSRNGRALAPTAANGALVLVADPRSPAAEAYRSLAATIQFAYPDGRLQTVGVTSAEAGEGKSTAAANLALALAEGGRKVIIIDADLRRPAQHTLFGVERGEGLATLLRDAPTQLPLLETGVPGVTLLPAGPTPVNPLEALASPHFEQVLALARAQADFVIVDTAPAGALADAAVLGPRLEGMLLVISAGHTRRDRAQRAREQLERVNANLLGVVLTDVKGDDKLYRY